MRRERAEPGGAGAMTDHGTRRDTARSCGDLPIRNAQQNDVGSTRIGAAPELVDGRVTRRSQRSR